MADAANTILGAAVLSSMAGATLKRGYEWATGADSKSRKRPRAYKSVRRSSTKPRFQPIMGRPVKMSNVIPKTLHTYFSSYATSYVTAASTGPFYFDVMGNNLHLPWAQTKAFDTAPFNATHGTPADTALGFHSLSQVLGAGSCYDSYCVDQFTLEISVIPASPIDNGFITIVPYKYFEGAFDGSLPTTLANARRVFGAKNGVFANDDPQRKIKFTCNVPRLFGMPKTICENDESFQARYGAAPVNYAMARVLINNAQGATTTNNISVSIKLTVRAKLFNADNTAVNATVV